MSNALLVRLLLLDCFSFAFAVAFLGFDGTCDIMGVCNAVADVAVVRNRRASSSRRLGSVASNGVAIFFLVLRLRRLIQNYFSEKFKCLLTWLDQNTCLVRACFRKGDRDRDVARALALALALALARIFGDRVAVAPRFRFGDDVLLHPPCNPVMSRLLPPLCRSLGFCPRPHRVKLRIAD